MCGIFGIVAHNARVPEGVLERGTRSLAHRGPDDSGTILLRDSTDSAVEIGLGNRRLAILDLSPLGHQPMPDAETGNWIVYNGEIYNFREVRAELERQGTKFVSHTDTEVVLKAYARWGDACLQKFRGMFAFAIWDATEHRLFSRARSHGDQAALLRAERFLFRVCVGSQVAVRDQAGSASNRSRGTHELSDIWFSCTTRSLWSRASRRFLLAVP